MHRMIAGLLGRDFSDWPTLPDYERLLAIAGLAACEQKRRMPARTFETMVFSDQCLPIRPKNAHDFLNAVIWAVFPRTKAAINRRLVQAGYAQTCNGRNRVGDAMTLFDECGLVLLCTDDRYPRLHRERRWSELFLGHRDDWGRSILSVVFGHGLLEQAMAPHPGLIGRVCWLRVAELTEEPGPRLASIVDGLLAESVPRWTGPAELPPLPVMGIPGYCDKPQNDGFYANTRVFRPLPEST